MTIGHQSDPKIVVKCFACNAELLTTLPLLYSGERSTCPSCSGSLKPWHNDPDCTMCGGQGVVRIETDRSSAIWICTANLQRRPADSNEPFTPAAKNTKFRHDGCTECECDVVFFPNQRGECRCGHIILKHDSYCSVPGCNNVALRGGPPLACKHH